MIIITTIYKMRDMFWITIIYKDFLAAINLVAYPLTTDRDDGRHNAFKCFSSYNPWVIVISKTRLSAADDGLWSVIC